MEKHNLTPEGRSAANKGAMIVNAREVLTLKDCDEIVGADRHSVLFAGDKSKSLSAIARSNMALFGTTLGEGRFLLESNVPEVRQAMRNSLLDIVQQLAGKGYLTMYAVYTTVEQTRGCPIAFWPAHVPHQGKFEVPCKLEDLLNKHFVLLRGER